MRALYLFLSFTILSFCSCTNLIWTSKPAITKPSDFDFGFKGTWEQESDPHMADREPNGRFQITRNDETKRTEYIAKGIGKPDEFVTFTAVRLNEKTNYAIVQFNLNPNQAEPSYYYAYAVAKNDKLYLWSIQSDKIVALIKKTELNSVIDRGGWTTHITANSEKLLQLMKDNARELSSAEPTVFKRSSK